jgi:tRNA A-37 threonylcarbamoyl transferase component Bud32
MTTRDPLFERLRLALQPRYLLEAELGRGGVGVVYRAEDTVLRRKVAIKMLLPGLASVLGEEAFLREARHLAQIRNPHVVQVYDVPPPPDGLCIFTMELMHSGTLADRLQRGPLKPNDTRLLGIDLLLGLEAIHREGLVHRDLKPSNVFPEPGRGVIGDLGISRHLEETGGGHTTTDIGRGTAMYMGPEQLGGLPATLATDIYQLGMVLYEASSGRIWPRIDPRNRSLWQGFPRWLRLPLQRALQLNPDDRWPSAAAFRGALQLRPVRWDRILISGAACLALLLALPPVVRAVWARISPPTLLHVDLTVLRFAGADTALANDLTRYVREPFSRFSRISVRPGGETPSLAFEPSHVDVQRLRTTWYVSGKVAGDSSSLELEVYDSTPTMIRRFTVPRGALKRLDWGWAGADSIVSRYFPHYYPDFQPLAGCGGSNDKLAIGEYLDGEEAFRRDAYALADRHFSQALQDDGSFFLAAWQRALAHRWLRTLSWADLQELRRRSAACKNTWFYRLLEAQLETDLGRRLDAYQNVIREYPSSGMARLLFADEVFHRGPLIGISLDSALAAMKEAIRTDSTEDQAPALDHVIWGATRLGDEDEARRAVESREKVAALRSPGAHDEGALRTRFLRLAYDIRFHPARGRLKLWWIGWHASPEIINAFSEYVHLASAFDIPVAQLAMGTKLTRSTSSTGIRAEGFEARGLALVALGRMNEAVGNFDTAAALLDSPASRLEAAEWVTLARALGLPNPSPPERELGLHRVSDLRSEPSVAMRANWALATEAYTRGDLSEGRRLTGAVRADTAAAGSGWRLVRLLAAFDSAVSGNPTAALVVSDSLLLWDPVARAGDPFARSILYLARGRWLVQLGRLDAADQALLWYQNGDLDGWGLGEAQAGQIDVALSGIARVRRARAALARKKPAQACAYLRRVGELWENSEPGFAALRDSVQTELGRCP